MTAVNTADAGASSIKDKVPHARVLIVDDEPVNVRLLERALSGAGFSQLRTTSDAREALPLFEAFEPDIVLLDLSMPYLDGFTILEELRKIVGEESYLPVLVLTADITRGTRERALSAGARDFLTKPFDTSEVVLRVRNLVETRLLHCQLQDQNEVLEAKERARTTELELALRELSATQQQIIQQERLHALGTMASGVAHDFNNALSIILGYGEIVLREFQEDSSSRSVQNIQTIITAAEDAAKIVGRLREFHGSGDEQVRQPVDLKALIGQALSFTEPRWKTQAAGRGSAIAVRLDLQDVPPVSGDAAELRELLTNMIFNAVDAMPEGGVLCFHTHTEDGHVVLEVGDTGVGMSEEVRQRCLEPFFTTKGERGTGLGLAMVYGIAQRHGGAVDIASEVGKGTTFTFRFPADKGSTDVTPSVAGEPEPPMRILVVDDQEILRDILAHYLEQDFHTVETAPSGEAALERFATSQFDLVITDQAMSGMNGDQLAAAIKARSPDTRVILLTGFGVVESPALSDAVDLVVGKPISLASLRMALVKARA